MSELVMWQYTKWVLFSTITTLPLVLTYYLRKRADSSLPDENYTYDFIFTTHKNIGCFKHIKFNKPCSNYCSAIQLEKIRRLLLDAKHTISLCMYLITLHDIAYELIACHRKGIQVRIITDYEMIPCGNHMIDTLKKAGIDIKTPNNSKNLMHHKFAVIDADESTRKVLFGSLNFSMQALLKNYENVIITNDEQILRGLNEEFEYLWKLFVTY